MNKNKLVKLAYESRKSIIKMSTDGGCFIGASLSCVDFLGYLYLEYMNIEKNNLNHPNRDILILSKGHDVPALYSIFAELDFIDKNRLKNHLKTNDNIYWHPNFSIPGVEFHSGSLGHGLSVSIGIALNSRIESINNKIITILGDGEINEGSVWESFLLASALNLSNLIVVVDRNKFQANLKTEDLIPLEPLIDKLKAFGWETYECDGHDFKSIDYAFKKLNKSNSNKPKFVIAHTTRGKGLPSIENDPTRWFVDFSKDEINLLLKELKSGIKTDLKSKKIIAR
tara:strand:- start:1070 stop:1921 length:852 start_codon:yes stop_codon:yes gene_type:complete